MNTTEKLDIVKIVLIGILLLFFSGLLCFLFLWLFTADIKTAKNVSLIFTLILIPCYGYFSCKFSSVLGVTKNQDKAIKIDTDIKIASTSCWILGIFHLFNAWGLFPSSNFKQLFFLLIIFCIGSAFCYSGYALREKKKNAGTLSIVTCIAAFIINCLLPGKGLEIFFVVLYLIIISASLIHSRDITM